MTDIFTPPGLERTADEREAAVKIGALKMTHDLSLVVRAYAGYDASEGWNRIYRAGLRLTDEQVTSFAEEYEALLRKYRTAPGEHPAGSRQMAVHLVMLPDVGARPVLPVEPDEE
ncbi:hypothetical protein OG338_16015 [Streptomyces sp. NBC_00726]|uniref:hypothetical protein n=1 Tax=Streptomyces sp. NBC_00726 TaxID=2903674 RepID=UPI003869713A